MNSIFKEAGLTAQEIAKIPDYIDGVLEFYGSPAYEKLYEYYAFEVCEMPYLVAKARTETPDEWIMDRLSQ